MKKILISIIALLVFSSCTDYLDVNTNPNALLPDDISAENSIRGAMLGNQFWHTSSAPRIMMIWMNQGTGSDRQYVAFNDWNNVTASSFDTSWSNAYRNSLYSAETTYNKALDEGKPNLAAVAQIIKANSLGTLISLWGDVPYSEAFNDEAFPEPKFDSQLALYDEVQNLLSNSISILEAGNIDVIKNDIYYDGSKAKWVKFAHSLKARYYLHLKKYDKAYSESILGIASPSDDFKALFLSDDGAHNPFFTFQENRENYLTAIDSYGFDILKNTSPRYRGHAKTNEKFRLYFNYTGSKKLNFSGKFGKTSSLPLVTVGEMLLIQAECQARLNGVAAGLDIYNDYRELLRLGYSIGSENDCFGQNKPAVDAHGNPVPWENQFPCSQKYSLFDLADFDAAGIENEDGIDPLNAFLREIYEERYVYFIGNLEAFVDFGRTNNIAEIELKEGNSGTPQRFLYAQSEINANVSVPSPIPSVTEKTPVHQ